MDNAISFKLKVWRQAGPKEQGRFETYEMRDIPTDTSFLEMLDILNEQLVEQGQEPIHFDHDCREGICGMCSLYINGHPHGPATGATTCQLYMRRFHDGETITVEPWRSAAFPVIKDLMVNRNAFDQIQQAGGYVSFNTGGAQDANAIPISKVAAAVTQDTVLERLRVFHTALRRDFCISNPRIAVLALNPHAGDSGLLGEEEQTVIAPAMKVAAEAGIGCYGPFAADGFFGTRQYEHYDGVLAMYHDQGLAPFKALAMNDGVNYTAGLPLVRTSPDHGTAFDIAGKGVADEASFRQAIYTAIDVWRNRQHWDEAHENPLPKLYQDRREDRRVPAQRPE